MRAEAVRQGLEELDRQVQYKNAKAADQAKIQARELAINAQIQKELEEEQRKRKEINHSTIRVLSAPDNAITYAARHTLDLLSPSSAEVKRFRAEEQSNG